jgi:hypothetical protein
VVASVEIHASTGNRSISNCDANYDRMTDSCPYLTFLWLQKSIELILSPLVSHHDSILPVPQISTVCPVREVDSNLYLWPLSENHCRRSRLHELSIALSMAEFAESSTFGLLSSQKSVLDTPRVKDCQCRECITPDQTESMKGFRAASAIRSTLERSGGMMAGNGAVRSQV